MRISDQGSEVSSEDSSALKNVNSHLASHAGPANDGASIPAGSGRRGLLALGMPLAFAGLLSACGKVVFGGTSTRIKRVPKAGANGNPDGDGDASGDTSASEGKNSGGVGDGYGTEGGGSGSPSNSPNPDGELPHCDPAGLGIVDLSKIETDPTLIVPPPAVNGVTLEGVKIWGRQSSALIALSLKKSIEQGSTLILTSPLTDNPAMGRVLGSRQIMNAAVDISSPSSLVWFDNINLSGITKLTLVLVPVTGMPAKIDIENKTTEFHAQSKRFARQFRAKPVVDIQLGALSDAEGIAPAAIQSFADHSPIFGEEKNGFGFARVTIQAFRATNIRTAGYVDKGNEETAHIAHARTNWNFPDKFKGKNTFVTDLLERDISALFVGATTTALRDEYTFVVYIPDDADNPTLYYRTMISVG